MGLSPQPYARGREGTVRPPCLKGSGYYMLRAETQAGLWGYDSGPPEWEPISAPLTLVPGTVLFIIFT